MTRRYFSREFKLEVVQLVHEQGMRIAEAARDLGLHYKLLRKWVKQYQEYSLHAFPGQGQMKPEQEEIARLKRELRKVKAERDIKKKRRPTSQASRVEIWFYREASRDLADAMDVHGA